MRVAGNVMDRVYGSRRGISDFPSIGNFRERCANVGVANGASKTMGFVKFLPKFTSPAVSFF